MLDLSREREGAAGDALPEFEVEDELERGPIGNPLYSACGRMTGEDSLDTIERVLEASRASRTLTMP